LPSAAFGTISDSDRVVDDDAEFSAYVGTHTIVMAAAKPESLQVNVAEGNSVYRYCNQDFLERLAAMFAFFEEEKDDWMSKDQMILTYTFGIFCAITLAIMSVYFCHRAIMPQVNQAIGTTYVSASNYCILN
jgi:hypothetical protein